MTDLRNKTCCFTGHRDIPERDRVQICQRAERIIRQLYSRGVRYYGVGGAIGFDTMMAWLLMELREKDLLDIKVILVKPFEGYTSRWSNEQRKQYEALLPLYDKVVCVSDSPGRQAYLARNRHIVKHSAFCIAYCTRATGGTAYTVEFARQERLTIYNVAETGSVNSSLRATCSI